MTASEDQTLPASANGSLMARLKEETRDLHTEAEKSHLEQALVKGELPREAFVAYLEQRLLLHRALEARIREATAHVPALAATMREEMYQVPYLEEDLRFYGGNATDPAPLDPVEETVAKIDDAARANPVALLGMLYVLEGSNNGARFIARAVRGAYRLEGTAGTRYLDPYGERQRELWAEFKATMDAQPFSPGEQEAIVEMAKQTFRFMIAIDAQTYEQSV